MHVGGTARISIFGHFPGENLSPLGRRGLCRGCLRCGFEGVSFLTPAERLGALELRCRAPRRASPLPFWGGNLGFLACFGLVSALFQLFRAPFMVVRPEKGGESPVLSRIFQDHVLDF